MKVAVTYDLEYNGEVLTPEQAGVPNIVDVPDDIEEHEISDFISDYTGWCVKKWEVIE